MIYNLYRSVKEGTLFPLTKRVMSGELSKYPEIASRALVTIIDAWTGGAASQYLQDDLGITKAIEEGKVRIQELEKLKSALISDLNKLQSQIAQLRDPSEFMENEAAKALSSLGFTVSRSIRDKMAQAVRSSDEKIKQARRKYLDESERLSSEAATIQSKLDQTDSEQSALEKKVDDLKTKNPISDWVKERL